jgi:hypothetical protein
LCLMLGNNGDGSFKRTLVTNITTKFYKNYAAKSCDIAFSNT